MKVLEPIYNSLPASAQSIALSLYGFKLKKLRYGKIFRNTLADLENTPASPGEEQRKLFDELLDVAFRSTPYYQDLLKERKFLRSEVTLENFTEVLPILEKKIVKNNPKAFYNKALTGRETVRSNTSGTTGAPLDLLSTKTSVAKNYAFFNQFLNTFGVNEFDRSVTLNGRNIVSASNQSAPFWRLNYAMNTLFCSSYHLDSKTAPLYIKAIERWQPLYIDSFPSSIYQLARFIVDNQYQHSINIRGIITSSETLSATQRAVIEHAFGCRVYDQYGCAEMAVAAYQSANGLYFIDPRYAIAEVVDDNGLPVKNGESGNLICTGLINHAMPLIRYRVGDVVKTSESQLDGYPYVLYLESIDGREDDVFISKSGYKVGRLDPIKGIFGVSEAQIIQKKISEITVKIVTDVNYRKSSAEKRITNALMSRLGQDLVVRFEYVNSIPRERNGKFRAMKSEI